MKDIIRSIVGLVLVALVLAIVVPFAIMGWRLADTWTNELTGQLLGGCIAIGAFAAAIIATMAGAGAFARLAGWRAPRYRDDPPPPITIEQLPPAWEDRPQLPAGPPPWGMTGGGQFDLLPPPQQDPRYSMETERREVAARKRR